MQIASHAARILAPRLVADLATGSGLHFKDVGRITLDERKSRALAQAVSEQHLEPACRPDKAAEPRADDP